MLTRLLGALSGNVEALNDRRLRKVGQITEPWSDPSTRSR